jgi:hypothetical protein
MSNYRYSIVAIVSQNTPAEVSTPRGCLQTTETVEGNPSENLKTAFNPRASIVRNRGFARRLEIETRHGTIQRPGSRPSTVRAVEAASPEKARIPVWSECGRGGRVRSHRGRCRNWLSASRFTALAPSHVCM